MKTSLALSIGLLAIAFLASTLFFRDVGPSPAPIDEHALIQDPEGPEGPEGRADSDRAILANLSVTNTGIESNDYEIGTKGQNKQISTVEGESSIDSHLLSPDHLAADYDNIQPVEIGEHLAVDECCEQQSGPAREIGEVLIP